MLNLASIESYLVLQLIVEAVLVVLIVIFIVRLRRLRGLGGRSPAELKTAIDRFLTESEKLSAQFTANLNEKKELSLGLLLKLERKINEMKRLLERAEAELSRTSRVQAAGGEEDKANPAAPESRALVLKLAAQGLGVEEIARQARLHRGEVELILDLGRNLER